MKQISTNQKVLSRILCCLEVCKYASFDNLQDFTTAHRIIIQLEHSLNQFGEESKVRLDCDWYFPDTPIRETCGELTRKVL